MKRKPLNEIKELNNEIIKNNSLSQIKDIKIDNFTQLLILKYLIENENSDVYQKDFEKILNIRKSTISGILYTMEKNNIIIRHHMTGSKGKLVSLSKKVTDAKDIVLEKLNYLEEKIIDGIEEKDLDIFFKVIDKMKKNIKKEGNKNV